MKICSIEETIEILANIQVCNTRIRLDSSDRGLITSIGKQVYNNLPLTLKQLDVIVQKIKKYKIKLELNGVDVNGTLNAMQLRMPLRQIQRQNKISIVSNNDVHCIEVSFAWNTEDFSKEWSKIEKTLTGPLYEPSYRKITSLTERNLYEIVTALEPLGFEISDELKSSYDKIKTIYENMMQYVPNLDYVNSTFVLNNVSDLCKKTIDSDLAISSNILSYINRLKYYGITHVSDSVKELVYNIDCHQYSKSLTLCDQTRYRIKPSQVSISELSCIVNEIEQWPVIIMVEDSGKVLSHVQSIIDSFSNKLSKSEMTVFFRLNEHPDALKFSEYVKDNNLNNYIDDKTKLVIISKSRIPKALIKSNWKPNLAILTCSHDFGKTSVYLNDIPLVIYYNDSITVKYDKIKGNIPIVDLQNQLIM